MSPSPPAREGTPEVTNSPADTIVVDMEPDRRSSSHTVEAASDGPSDLEWRESASPLLHTTWKSTTTAMAKCDFCQLGSRGTLQRCCDCGVSICEECFDAGRLDRRHQLDADRIDWNQHNKTGRQSKRRASRARPRMASFSTAALARTSQSQERGQVGGATPPDTASPSNPTPSTPERPSTGVRSSSTLRGERDGSVAVRHYQGNNGYTLIRPRFPFTVEQTHNNWNSEFSQPPGRYPENLNGYSTYHGAALSGSEDPYSRSNSFNQPQNLQQQYQVSSAYHGSAPSATENPSSWNTMSGQPQTGHQYDQVPSSQNGFASSYGDEWRQSVQPSSAYSVDQSAYHHHQGPVANHSMPLNQASSSSWQPDPPYTSALGCSLYYADLSNYDLVSIAVAPTSYPRSPNRVRSTPRALPGLSIPSPSPYTLQHEPAGPPRRYEDYCRLHQTGAASSQDQGPDQHVTNHLAYRLPSIHMTAEGVEDDGHDTGSSR